MLQHLLENAAEAQLDDASIQIETYDVCKNPQKNGDADPKDSDSLCIKISDTGIGMSPETCQQIFDPFFTAGKSYGHKGLGLCAVLGIVKKHSGLIVVKTLQGKGTSISLCFPMTAQTNRITRG
jgi:signal transduction histidine kinase